MKSFSLVKPSTISCEQLRDALNTYLKLDPAAMTALVAHREPCNQRLAASECVVRRENGHDTLGFLGVLNGILGPATGLKLAAVYDTPETNEALGPVRGFALIRLPK